MSIKSSIFSLLGQSPAIVLNEHMTKVNTAVEALLPFLDAVDQKDWQRAQQLYLHISELEHQADEIKKDLHLHLPKSKFSSLSSGDILELIGLQDTVANRAKYIAKIILEREMLIPPSLLEPFKEFLQRSVEVTYQAAQAVKNLDNLLNSHFEISQLRAVENFIEELDRIEQIVDDKQTELRKMLFKIENDLTPLQAIFLYKLIDWVGGLADSAQHVGERLQMILIRT